MAHFIFMLTKNDVTIPNAAEVFKEIRGLGLRYVGFKDIGLPFDKLKSLTKEIQDNGQEVMLEVVSVSKHDEIRSVSAALDLGVDYLIGGTNAKDVLPIIAGSRVKYCPFPGKVIGHPSLLRGTLEEIVHSAKTLSQMPGVFGLDLLAYRFDGNVSELTRKVVQAASAPVIAAGSVDSEEKIRDLTSAGVWGFTVGSAIFEGKFGGSSVAGQIKTILSINEKLSN